ncbi:MAG TPA: hypothetical protein ENN56_04865, partial [Firmicutes bacterium]|nr:hypothetical protein [Bacillota bacterium]
TLALPDDTPEEMLYYSLSIGMGDVLVRGGNRDTTTLRLEPGISGELVYAGNGDYGGFNNRDVVGSIAVMDFTSGTNFINARILGAKAVIFVDDGMVNRSEAERKFLNVPADVSRFWVEGEVAERVKALGSVPGNRVTLTSRMEWTAVTAYNIWGTIPGTRTNTADSTVVLQAYYDAMSVVPRRAIGAENAVSMATLLSVAESFSVHPPEIPFTFLATSGHFTNLSGINEWLYRHVRKESRFLENIPEDQRIEFGLFIGLDLSSENDQIGAFAQGTYYSGWNTDARRTNMHTGYGRAFLRYSAELFPGQEVSEAYPQYADGIAPAKRTWRTYTPTMLAFDHEPVNYVGLSAFSFATTNDARIRVDTPVDTLGALNTANALTQARTIAGLMYRAARDQGFFQDTKIQPKDTQRELTGRILQFDRRKSFIPNSPIPEAVVTVAYGQKTYTGVRGLNVTLTNGFGEDGRDWLRYTLGGESGIGQSPDDPGRFRFHMLAPHVGAVTVKAYKIADSGRIVMAPDLGEEGDKTYPMAVGTSSAVIQTLQVLFEARAMTMFEIVDSRYLTALDMLNLRGPDGSELRSFGMEVVPLQSRAEGNVENAAVVFARPGTRVKVMMSTSLFGIKYLLINAPQHLFTNPITPRQANPEAQEIAEGIGYLIDEGVITKTPQRVAQDMWAIDDVRMKTLQRYGVVNQRVLDLHTQAREALLAADVAFEARDYGTWIREARHAWGLEARAYPDVKGTAVDTVQGVVFYFALLLPFAYFMERMIIGAVDIRRQLLGFASIFVGVFVILQFVHPAFKLSSSPYIIFLGFVIFALGTVVTVIVVGRFNDELKKMKQSQSGMHEADVGRIQATAAAISLGINNLRKRPLRTTLTAVTIAILTFSVLSFTSVVTSLQFYKINRSNEPTYDGMLIRDRNWMGLQPSVLEYVATAFHDKALITPRSWLMAQVRADKAFIDFVNLDNHDRSFAGGLLGVVPEEDRVTNISAMLTAGRWFNPGERGVVILPERMASIVNISPDDVGKVTIDMLG